MLHTEINLRLVKYNNVSIAFFHFAINMHAILHIKQNVQLPGVDI